MNFLYPDMDLDRPSFRVARLKAGCGDGPIECELISAFLDDDVIIDYEAISYTWGDATRSFHNIFLGCYLFPVGNNLWHVLHDIRQPEEDRLIWVDAICIDQASHGERNHQVQQMREVYNHARRVIFWLGPLTSSIGPLGPLMDWLVILQKEKPSDWPNKVQKLRETSPMEYFTLQRGLFEIINRPWFSRVWIIQEVANARNALVHCGSRSVSAKVLPSCPDLFNISYLPTHCQAVLDVMPGVSRSTSWWSQSRDVLTLLRKFRDSGASREHDKIYALRGLCHSDTNLPRTDYTVSISKVIADTIADICGCNARYLGEMFTTFDQFAKSLDKIYYEVLAQLSKLAPFHAIKKFLREQSEHVRLTAEVLEATILPRLFGPQLLQHRRRELFVMLSSGAGYQAAVQSLLDGSFSTNWTSWYEISTSTPSFRNGYGARVTLDFASLSNPIETAQLLESGADVNFPDAEGRTPLHFASLRNQFEIARLLLNSGAEVNFPDAQRQTALHLASMETRIEIARLLLNSGAYVDFPDAQGRTALQFASMRNEIETAQLLLNSGADVDFPDARGQTALHFALHSLLISETAKLLLDRGADVNRQDGEGQTALHIASAKGELEIVRLLLENGADANIRDGAGRTPLYIASMRGQNDIRALLIDRGSDEDATDKLGKTPTQILHQTGVTGGVYGG